MGKRILTFVLFFVLVLGVVFYAQPYCSVQGMLGTTRTCSCRGWIVVVSDSARVATDSEPYRTRCIGIVQRMVEHAH